MEWTVEKAQDNKYQFFLERNHRIQNARKFKIALKRSILFFAFLEQSFFYKIVK